MSKHKVSFFSTLLEFAMLAFALARSCLFPGEFT
jgi:hypothetical protein